MVSFSKLINIVLIDRRIGQTGDFQTKVPQWVARKKWQD